jgi:acetylornithine/succinyldiaminopimelate/putrescine aminotransferase
MFDYGGIKYASKEEVIEKSIRFWNPDKTRFWQKAGNIHTVTNFMTAKMKEMMAKHGDIFTGVRQKGVILGLEFNQAEGAVAVSRARELINA